MATEIPTLQNGGIRNGGKTYVIHLKPGMRWSNGAEITSADAKFGWQVNADPANENGCSPTCVVARVDTPNRYTVTYYLHRVDSSFLIGDLPQPWPVRWPGAWDGDPHAAMLKLNTFDFLGPTYPTDGPYQVVQSVGSSAGTVQIDLRPMKYYTVMNCGGYIGTITYRRYFALPDVVRAITTHDVDISDSWNYFRLTQLQRSGAAYRTHIDPSNSIEHVELNVDPQFAGKPNPLHDALVRQALALALDKRSLVANSLELTPRQTSNVIQWSFCVNSPKYRSACADRSITGAWDPIAHRYDPNPGRGIALLDAKRLLGRSRWSHGFPLDLASRGGPIVLLEEAALTTSWARLGVTVTSSNYSGDSLFGSWAAGGVLAHGRFQAALFEIMGSGLYPDTAFPPYLASNAIDRRSSDHTAPNLLNISGIRDPVIDRALAVSARSLQPKVRARAYAVIQEEMARQAYWDVLYAEGLIYTEDRRLANLSASVESAQWIYWNVWAWKLNH
jgi:ABC-type transport system substrate-binding protein